eukprot:6430931-Alexandrium_andersonii.AAC.1
MAKCPRLRWGVHRLGFHGCARIVRIEGWRLATYRDFATADPLNTHVRCQIRNLHEQWRRMHPLGVLGIRFEAALGPAQLQPRTF